MMANTEDLEQVHKTMANTGDLELPILDNNKLLTNKARVLSKDLPNSRASHNRALCLETLHRSSKDSVNSLSTAVAISTVEFSPTSNREVLIGRILMPSKSSLLVPSRYLTVKQVLQ